MSASIFSIADSASNLIAFILISFIIVIFGRNDRLLLDAADMLHLRRQKPHLLWSTNVREYSAQYFLSNFERHRHQINNQLIHLAMALRYYDLGYN